MPLVSLASLQMRVVADTNIIVSGLFWHGSPRLVLDAARNGAIDLYTSGILLEELEDVLIREKFAERWQAAGEGAHELVLGYGALAKVVEPAKSGRLFLPIPTTTQSLPAPFPRKAKS